MQGTAIVVVGKKEYHVQKGDVVVTPPYTTHFIITLSNDFVIAEVNTPSFNIGNYVPISESDDTFGFDKAQFERLIHAHYK